MKVELLIRNDKTWYEPVVLEDIELNLERWTAGKCTFKVLQDDVLKLSEGNAVQIKVDNKNLFYGFIFTRGFEKDGVVSITAYDQLIYLIKNKYSYVFTGKKMSEIITLIANDYKLTCGDITDTGYVIPTLTEDNQSLMDIIGDAHDFTLTNTSKLYALYDDFGKLTLKNIEDMKLNLLIDDETAENYNFVSSIDGETYNKIVLYYENTPRDVFIAQSGENINKWGTLQYFERVEKGENAQAKADNLLKLYNKPLSKFTIQNAFGDVNVKAGSAVVVNLALADGTKYKNYMMVDKVVHKFENELHTMDLTLKGCGVFG